jgi:hypothetical protein
VRVEESGSYVSKAGQDKLDTHASDVGSTHVGSVHERHAVHGTDGNNKSTIDSSNDAALLRDGEAIIVVLLGAELAGGMVKVFGLCSLEVRNLFVVLRSFHGANDVILVAREDACQS